MATKLTATLHYVQEAYGGVADPSDINGRRLAGSSFFKGFLKHTSSDVIQLLSGDATDLTKVKQAIEEIAPGKRVQWVERFQLTGLGAHPVILRPDPALTKLAYQRMNIGQNAFSLCGVTHTTAGYRLPDPFVDARMSPVEPWDGLICTAETVKTSLDYRFDAIDEYLARRFGGAAPARPQMPVIPLGINTDEFQVTAEDRAILRAEIGAGDDDIVVSTLARLSPHFKFDPFPIYLAMQKSAEATGKTLHLLFSGFFLGDYAEDVFRKGAAALAPGVKVHFRKADNKKTRREALAGSDIFVFAIDSIQETFGLAPIEAMAAGLPVIASDWNGMKDTVTPDVGFRVPTRSVRGAFSKTETMLNQVDYDGMVSHMTLMSAMAEVSVPDLADKISLLATRGDLRKEMGEAGRRRAAEVYDWSRIIPQYEAFWAELDAIRRAASPEAMARYDSVPSPVAPPVFDFFACYPTRQSFGPEEAFRLTGETAADRLSLIYQVRDYKTLKRTPLNLDAAQEMLDLIGGWKKKKGPSFPALVKASEHSEEIIEKTLIWLLKYDLIETVTP